MSSLSTAHFIHRHDGGNHRYQTYCKYYDIEEHLVIYR